MINSCIFSFIISREISQFPLIIIAQAKYESMSGMQIIQLILVSFVVWWVLLMKAK